MMTGDTLLSVNACISSPSGSQYRHESMEKNMLVMLMKCFVLTPKAFSAMKGCFSLAMARFSTMVYLFEKFPQASAGPALPSWFS